MSVDPRQIVVIDYTNHRGERAKRRIWPERVYFGATHWHPERQWLLSAEDVDKHAYRDFAISQIHSWIPEK